MGRKGKDLTVETKERICDLIKDGLQFSEVAKLLNLHPETVRQVHKRFCDRKTVENNKRSGRPIVFTKRCMTALSRIVKQNRLATISEICAEFFASTSVRVCEKTIKRKLHILGYSKRVPAKKVVIREVNRKKRLQYCRGKLTWTVNNKWKRVIFSDEMTIVIKPNGRVKLWRKVEEKWSVLHLCFLHVGPQATLKLMVWGCIGYDKVGPLVFVDGTMNSAKYIGVLGNHFLPFVAEHYRGQRWYLQEDNASIHRSAQTEEWKRQHRIPAFFWPPQSPDLNPVENVWNVLKNNVRKHIRDIKCVADLRDTLTTCWNSLTVTYLHSLYESLPRRCQQVLRRKGHMTKY
jgi:transposase